MLLCAPTEYLSSVFSVKESVKILADAGYKAYDFSLCGKHNARAMADSEDYRRQAEELRKYADSLGISCTQSHAYFPSSVGDEVRDREIFEKIIRDMEIASVLGAEIICVHPKQHLKYKDNAEKLFQMNVEFYNSLIPYCEKFGIKVAMENMWQYEEGAGIVHSTCASPTEFVRYMDAVNSEWIVGLLDIGHTALVKESLGDFIRTLGNKRLRALHIHDNDTLHDSHNLPFTMKLDFNELTSALREIDYKGNFTYEADSFYKGFPNELLPKVACFMRQVGDYLVEQI